MTYHRAANLIDYAFSTLHLKQARLTKDPHVEDLEAYYQFTGYDMQKEARLKDKEMKSLTATAS